MNTWLIVSAACGVLCVAGGIIGAIKSNEGAIGVVANLSIPTFFGAIILVFATPNPEQQWQKILIVSGVALIGIVMAESNRRHNKIMLENIKKGMFYR